MNSRGKKILALVQVDNTFTQKQGKLNNLLEIFILDIANRINYYNLKIPNVGRG